MIQPIMNQDLSVANLVEGKHLFWAKNIVISEKFNTVLNERGNRFLLNVNETPNATTKEIIGIVEVGNDFIVFSGYYPIRPASGTGENAVLEGDYTNSEIGVVNTDLGIYTPISGLSIYSSSLRFNRNYPITGVFKKNFKGEIIVAFRDDRNKPKVININTIESPTLKNVDSENDLLLFPDSKLSNINLSVRTGGGLLSGEYYVTYNYENDDKTTTAYFNISNPVWIIKGGSGNFDETGGDAANLLTDKQIIVAFDRLDTRYKYINLVLISKLAGVTTAKKIKRVAITGTSMSTNIIGTEVSEDLTLEEVLIKPAFYDRVHTITTFRDSLWGANLRSPDEIVYQNLANSINIEFISFIQQSNAISNSHKSNNVKGFVHGEVYAFYIRFILPNGAYTRAFHIPGRIQAFDDVDATPIDNLNRLAGSGFDTSPLYSDLVPKWKMEDTTSFLGSYIDTTAEFNQIGGNTNYGTMGYWENEDESYPDEGGFPVGKVRHHKFPSIAWCKENLYSTNNDYGKSVLDVLGIKVKNVTVPVGVQGYEILYAKRNYNNATIVTTDIIQFAGARSTGIRIIENHNSNIKPQTTGGNWYLRRLTPSGERGSIALYKPYIRLHSFDLLYNKPALSNLYLARELFLKRTNLNKEYAIIGKEGGTLVKSGNQFNESQLSSAVVDYSATNSVVGRYRQVSVYPNDNLSRFRKIGSLEYLPNNTESITWNNIYGEDCALARVLGAPLPIYPSEILSCSPNQQNYNGNTNNEGAIWNNWLDSPSVGTTSQGVEHTNLITIRQLLSNVYSPFENQELVTTGKIILTNQTNPSANPTFVDIVAGDCFIGYNSWVNTAPPEFNANSGSPLVNSGVIMFKRHLGEFTGNVGLRYAGTANEDALYPITKVSPEFARQLDISRQLTNWTLYNKDYSSLNDLITADIFTPYIEYVSKFPYRIIRSKPSGNEDKSIGWKTFLANDYFEMERNKGYIENIEAFGYKLIIHTQFGLFLTRDVAKLETDILNVTLGSGDLFDVKPEEIIPDVGYAGTHNQLACKVTKLGYIFPEVTQGKVFILSTGLKEISSDGFRRFFFEHLALKKTNVISTMMKVPFTSKCINGKLAIIIPKVKNNADCIPTGNTIYALEYDIDMSATGIGTIATVTTQAEIPNVQAAVYVNRSHYILYTTTDFNNSNFPNNREVEGYINMLCYQRNTVIDYSDNPFIGKGITLAYDEDYNRIILTKNNKGNTVITGRFKGTLRQRSLLCEWEEGDLVFTGDSVSNNGIPEYKELRLSGKYAANQVRLYVAQNPT